MRQACRYHVPDGTSRSRAPELARYVTGRRASSPFWRFHGVPWILASCRSTAERLSTCGRDSRTYPNCTVPFAGSDQARHTRLHRERPVPEPPALQESSGDPWSTTVRDFREPQALLWNRSSRCIECGAALIDPANRDGTHGYGSESRPDGRKEPLLRVLAGSERRDPWNGREAPRKR